MLALLVNVLFGQETAPFGPDLDTTGLDKTRDLAQPTAAWSTAGMLTAESHPENPWSTAGMLDRIWQGKRQPIRKSPTEQPIAEPFISTDIQSRPAEQAQDGLQSSSAGNLRNRNLQLLSELCE